MSEASKSQFWKKKDFAFYALASALPIGIVLFFFYLLGLRWVGTANNFQNTAEYGDSFGFVNALFSGLAFAGVITAILIQTRELRQAYEEAQDSRVAAQSNVILQHCSAQTAAISTLSDLHRKLEGETKDALLLMANMPELERMLRESLSRAVLANQISLLLSFDPTSENPAGDYRNFKRTGGECFDQYERSKDLLILIRASNARITEAHRFKRENEIFDTQMIAMFHDDVIRDFARLTAEMDTLDLAQPGFITAIPDYALQFNSAHIRTIDEQAFNRGDRAEVAKIDLSSFKDSSPETHKTLADLAFFSYFEWHLCLIRNFLAECGYKNAN